MSDEKWEEWIRKQIEKKKVVLEVKQKRDLKKYLSTIKGLITIEIIIGLLAVFFMFYKFGGDKLIETLLDWIIGITIVTTIIVIIGRYGKVRF